MSYFEEIGAWPKGAHSLARAYIAGFALSLVLTLAAYGVVVEHALTARTALLTLGASALVQFLVQVVCFFHPSTEAPSRERLAVFAGAVLVVGILVAGSLWIMFDLGDRMMSDSAMMQYMQDQQGI